MSVEGKVSGGKQIGPYARLLTFAPGEIIMRQGDWGGNTFYFSADAALNAFVTDESGKHRKVGDIEPGSCFGEMSVLADVPRNATFMARSCRRVVTRPSQVGPALRVLGTLRDVDGGADSCW